MSVPYTRRYKKKAFIELITFYKNCFAWDYHELSRLDKELVEHCLPIMPKLGLINTAKMHGCCCNQ